MNSMNTLDVRDVRDVSWQEFWTQETSGTSRDLGLEPLFYLSFREGSQHRPPSVSKMIVGVDYLRSLRRNRQLLSCSPRKSGLPQAVNQGFDQNCALWRGQSHDFPDGNCMKEQEDKMSEAAVLARKRVQLRSTPNRLCERLEFWSQSFATPVSRPFSSGVNIPQEVVSARQGRPSPSLRALLGAEYHCPHPMGTWDSHGIPWISCGEDRKYDDTWELLPGLQFQPTCSSAFTHSRDL